MDLCVFCKESLTNGQPTTKLGSKGCESIARASESRKSDMVTSPGQIVHSKCRKDFCAPNSIISANRKRDHDLAEGTSTPSTRQSTTPFDYNSNCLFCGHPDKYHGKKDGHKLIPIRTFDFQVNVLEHCVKRDDEWSSLVRARIEYAQDLHALDAVYHHICSTNFRTQRQIPQQFMLDVDIKRKRPKPGRNPDAQRVEAFDKVIAYFEGNDDEQTTVHDLIAKMREFLDDDCEPYGFTYMKAKLQERFGDEIVITELQGKMNVVTFCHTAASIIQKFYNQPKKGTADEEKIRIIETAAKLIKSDVKTVTPDGTFYPSSADMSSTDTALSYLPDSLQLLLQTMAVGNMEKRTASIGQALMQYMRPRTLIPPLQIGLAVQLHHHFGSRFLIESLHEHGFCSSYKEVQKFERCAAVAQNADIPQHEQDQFIQFVADNVDHNIRTLDGLNTFHGMGIIATVTPGKPIVRRILRRDVRMDELQAVGHIQIHNFVALSGGLDSLRYEILETQGHVDTTAPIDLLWKVSLLLCSPRPSWSGTMQAVHKGLHPGQSSVYFMPMIDMNPGDMSCILSTLIFVCDTAMRYNTTPILTFDQPLWWKAMTIIKNEPEQSDLHGIVLRLGGFHTLLSFLGAVGHIMAGSGLRSLLELIYAENTVNHILSGKAYDRAVRGHLLVDAGLNTMIAAKMFGMPLPLVTTESQEAEDDDIVEDQGASAMDEDADSGTSPVDEHGTSPVNEHGNTKENWPDNTVIHSALITELQTLYNDLMSGNEDVEKSVSKDVLQRLRDLMITEKESLMESRTALLWMEYMDMIDIMRRFIKSERTGNWDMHVQVMKEMLPYLAASGHNLYTKSIYVYLQTLDLLPVKHPEVLQHFRQGFHVVRRSDRYWAGLSTDLVIEQALMRNLKTTGGLTRGRGMNESQRVTWLLSTPACVDINEALQKFTSVEFKTSDQHKDCSAARQQRDTDDTSKIIGYMDSKNPFDITSPTLHSLDTGIVAHKSVNVDHAAQVGKKILEKMAGQKVSDFVFKKSDHVVTLASKHSVKTLSDTVTIDPLLLFQRFITAGYNSGELADVLKCELCAYPPALFEATGVMLQPNKAALADAIWGTIQPSSPQVPQDVSYVLDGGALIHKIPWITGQTYESLCGSYSDYVKRKYGQATIVFDGYTCGPSTKDNSHLRRKKSSGSNTVLFTRDMACTLHKEDFLSNKENKQRFIYLLGEALEQQGCVVLHADADADVLLVQTAIASAGNKNTVLVGDDTDLLILLCSIAKDTPYALFFRPEKKFNAKKPAKCWDISLTKGALSAHVCNNLLFVHALLGCDTTSRVFGIGKRAALKKLQQSEYFGHQAEFFCNPAVSYSDIDKAGENALVCLYGGEQGENLNALRLRQFCQRVASSSTYVQPCSLPPTSAAAKFHSRRVYHQVQTWKGKSLNAEDWGWSIRDGIMTPTGTDQKPAPDYLMEAIHCNCRTDCSTRRCSCRKYGLECSPACGDCKGLLCTNVTLDPE